MGDTKRGIINLHLGQCGVQIADTLWGLFCLEHDVCVNGTLKKKNRKNLDLSTNDTFFEECANGKYVPRSVLFDTEPSVVDVLRTGRKRDLFRPDCLISGKEDAGNVFSRGYYTLGDDMKDLVLDRIRKVAEACSGVQGFSIFRSYGGGTGSGFGSVLMRSLREDYPKLTQIEIATVPSGHFSTSVVEPYNAVFSTHESLLDSDCALFFDNESLYNMLSKKLETYSPTYKDINRMISQIFSAMTASLRFSSTLKLDFTEVQTNLVPYPRLHFPIASIAPVLPKNYLISYNEREVNTVKITKSLFNKFSFALMGDPANGKYMSCCIMYRGQVIPKEINSTIHMLKRTRSIQFVDWCPTGFKIGINHAKMIIPKALNMEPVQSSAVMLANTTAINELWATLNQKYDLMNRKRSFWHHYIQEGMPEEDFLEFREDLAALELDYMEVAEDSRDVEYGAEEQEGGDHDRLSSINELGAEDEQVLDSTSIKGSETETSPHAVNSEDSVKTLSGEGDSNKS